MNRRAWLPPAVVVVLVWLGSAMTAAAQGFGAIGGTVADVTGAVLPGATVQLSSAQGTVGGNQESTTDARGLTRLDDGLRGGRGDRRATGLAEDR